MKYRSNLPSFQRTAIYTRVVESENLLVKLHVRGRNGNYDAIVRSQNEKRMSDHTASQKDMYSMIARALHDLYVISFNTKVKMKYIAQRKTRWCNPCTTVLEASKIFNQLSIRKIKNYSQ
jgi:hypothetical protein